MENDQMKNRMANRNGSTSGSPGTQLSALERYLNANQLPRVANLDDVLQIDPPKDAKPETVTVRTFDPLTGDIVPAKFALTDPTAVGEAVDDCMVTGFGSLKTTSGFRYSVNGKPEFSRSRTSVRPGWAILQLEAGRPPLSVEPVETESTVETTN